MLVVEKYTSKLFHRSQTKVPNSHFPANSTDALNDIAHSATNISATESDTTKKLVMTLSKVQIFSINQRGGKKENIN